MPTQPAEGRPTQQIGATGDQYDWQRGPRRLSGPRELEPIHEGHRNVRDQAVNFREATALEQRRSGREKAYFVVGRVQQAFDRLEHPRVIVDDGNDRAARMVGHGYWEFWQIEARAVCNRKM